RLRDQELPNTPPVRQIQPPVTPRTHRRAEARDANNVLTDSPQRRRRRPVAPAAPLPPPPPQPIIPQPAGRHVRFTCTSTSKSFHECCSFFGTHEFSVPLFALANFS